MDERLDMPEVIVVGAGPTGLLVAAELALGGVRVQVLDRLDRPDPTIKAGSINVATAEILDRRGLLPAARAAHAETAASVSRFAHSAAGSSGRSFRQQWRAQSDADPGAGRFPVAGHFAGLMLRPDLVDHDDPALRAHRAVDGATLVTQHQFETLLADHAAALDVQVRRGVEVTGLDQDEHGVTLQTSSGPLSAGWVVAADGGRSVLRHLLELPFIGTEAEITGYQAIADLEGAEALRHGWTWTPTGVYSYGPIPGRILTVQFTGPPADRSAPVTVQEVQDSIRLVSGAAVTVTALHGQATRWTDNARQVPTYRAGRVLLAGDAAHVHSPFSGQGLNLGAGDAGNLGWKLAATVRGWAPDGLLDTYDTERRPIGAWVLDWTRAQVALMRGDRKVEQMRSVVQQELLGTAEGMTRVAALTAGIAQRYPLTDGDADGVGFDRRGPLDLGRLLGDVALADGSRLADHCHRGTFVLLDRSGDHEVGRAAEPWTDRLTVAVDPAPGPSALLRPDGVVAWMTGTDSRAADLVAVLTRWAGEPDGSG